MYFRELRSLPRLHQRNQESRLQAAGSVHQRPGPTASRLQPRHHADSLQAPQEGDRARRGEPYDHSERGHRVRPHAVAPRTGDVEHRGPHGCTRTRSWSSYCWSTRTFSAGRERRWRTSLLFFSLTLPTQSSS
ncbi:uncharacterized protein LOC117533490 isoform X2 [Gymnodraco acuticeps]|uniref:Uncharacterized protein LOC117533490 isoform X2 n=1 Tax=Gymnodraco acuticeps TaxID=8218 RepID=A0A6P8SS23_GYMAC|nr:uncharacterized protein LOC117533490 isoform X2 [Gymnodraco acuticeps]